MEKPREIRIGLVLYGGVSLAVYINGVAQEFFRAVRGDGIYRLLKAMLGADIVVDVISGTSAGGINGLYLAYALCRDNKPNRPPDFLRFSTLWRQHGDIARLLRQPGEPNANSLLDGEGYYQDKLQEAFGDLDANDWTPSAAGEDPSPLPELDLFITGTNYAGSVYTRFDDCGHPITVKDHRNVFQLKYRASRADNDFARPEPELHAQLAKLARITSCFPVAFPPVHVDTAADPLLARWGHLSAAAEPRYYLDGGVLDNKPFSSTLNAIFHRMAPDRKVTRKLFYVEPVPEVFGKPAVTESPNVVEAGLAALTGIPSYESIAADLQEIRDRNTRIHGFRKLARDLNDIEDPDAVRVAPEQRAVYHDSRINALLDRVLTGILRTGGHDVTLTPEQQRLASSLYRRLFEGFYSAYTPGQREQILAWYDVQILQRRLFHVNYILADQPELSAADWQAKAICSRWVKCLEVIQYAMEFLIDARAFHWERFDPHQPATAIDVWQEVGRALDHLLQPDDDLIEILRLHPDIPGYPDSNTLSRFLGLLRKRIAAISKTDPLPPVEGDTILGFLTAQFDDGAFLGDSLAARKAWSTFPLVDTLRYPLQVAAGIFEMDPIQTIRVSPLDAQLGLSRRDASEKLSGDQFANFGGFFKRSWRSNDVLCGRIDGVCQIVEALFTREAFEVAPADADSVAARKAVIDELFPPNAAPEIQELRGWLLALSDRADPYYAAALERLDPETAKLPGSLVDHLVRYAQESLLRDGMEMVVADSIQEQIDWNLCRVQSGEELAFHVDALRFTRPNAGFIGIAAQKIAQQAICSGEVPDLAAFFLDRNRYTIGQESIAKDVPRPVLAETASRAMLVFRDCIVPRLKKNKIDVTATPVYRYGFEWPVRLAHGFANMVRFAPTSARVVTWVLFLASVAALVAGVTGWDQLIWHGGDFAFLPFLLLIGLPFAYLSTMPELLEWQYPGTGTLRSWLPASTTGAMLALTVMVFALLYRIEGRVAEFIQDHAGAISYVMLALIALLAINLLIWLYSVVRRRLA